MTVPVLCLAAALLAWPDPGSGRRARFPGDRGDRSPWTVRRMGDRLGPVPAAGLAALAGAALGSPLVAVLAAGCAALAARAWARRRAAEQEEARLRALTEALAALAADLRAGRPVDAAAAGAARAVADEELRRALLSAARPGPGPAAPAPARAGPVAEPLDRLTAAMRLSARTGASLAEVVTAVEDDLRARQRHRRELRAALAAPRASGTLLAGLPVLGLAMGNGVGADPWHVLTQTGAGQVLLVAGVALEVVGIAWTHRLVARATRHDTPVAP